MKWVLKFYLSIVFISISQYAQAVCNINLSDQSGMTQLYNVHFQDINTALSASGITAGLWGVGDYCDWYGVTTENIGGEDRVIAINVSDLGINGNLLASIGLIGSVSFGLEYLEEFDISKNNFTGDISSVFFENGTNLRILALSENNFNYSTTLFEDLFSNSDMNNLTEFLAADMYGAATIVGDLPTFPTPTPFKNTLLTLDLSNNRFTGEIPPLEDVGRNQDLYVDLSDNLFIGFSTTTRVNGEVIEKLDISNNDFVDFSDIIFIIENIDELEKFYARNTMKASGTYDLAQFPAPDVINNDVDIEDLDLSANGIAGVFDIYFVGDSLTNLWLDDNQIVSIDGSFGDVTRIEGIYISGNKLESIDSTLFAEAPSIREIDLSYNLLSGEFPNPQTTFQLDQYNFPNLESVNLAYNNLSGNINLNWLLGAQMDIGVGTQLREIMLDSNFFSSVTFNVDGFVGVFDTLLNVDVSWNRLHFDDLYTLAKGFGMQQYTASNNSTYYIPLGVDLGGSETDILGSFEYGDQAVAGIGGVRRRPIGESVPFPAGVRSPSDFPNTTYNWVRDTLITFSNPELMGVTGFDGLGDFLLTPGNATATAGSLIPAPGGEDFVDVMLINDLDSTHNEWWYSVCVDNDSFPDLTICVNPKLLIVGECYDDEGRPIPCQQIIVTYDPNSTTEERAAIRSEFGVEVIDSCTCAYVELWGLPDTLNQLLVEQNGSGTSRAASQAQSKPKLLGADPNYGLLGGNLLPGDANPAPPSGSTVQDPTIVAILDSGVDYDHPSLSDRILLKNNETVGNEVDDDGNCWVDDGWGYNMLESSPFPYDDHGHGTNAAGIIAGLSTPNLATSIAGQNDPIAIMPLKYTNKNGEGSIFNAACGIFYASTNGAKVINASWGYYGDTSSVLASAIDFAEEQGVLFICSAGNDGEDVANSPHWPSNFNTTNVIAVASLDETNDDVLAGYSNYGNQHIDLASTGTFTSTTKSGVLVGATEFAEGTSFATAQVARVAGLLMADYPDASHCAIRYAMTSTVYVLESADSSKLETGGRLDYEAAAAKLAAMDPAVLGSCDMDTLLSSVEIIETTIFGEAIKIYPNPFNGHLFIEANDLGNETTERLQLQVSNTLGVVLFKQQIEMGTTFDLDTSGWPSGVYIINFEHNGNQWANKLIKS